MVATLRPMTEGEFARWLADSSAGFLVELLEAGRPADQAEAFVAARYAEWFPGDRPAEGHQVYVMQDADVRVAIAWLGPHPQRPDDRNVLWLYDIEVDAARRGHGLGRRALALVEEAARALGAARLELNVFGANRTARGLYQSAGYTELAVTMGKALNDPG